MNRVISISLSPRGFGYAVFEGAELIDWGLKGTSRLRGRHRDWCVRQAERLMEDFVPEILVLEDYCDVRYRRGRAVKHLLARVATRAAAHGVKVRRVPKSRLGRLSWDEARPTKYQIAVTVARRFPELTWRLPPVRKPWMSEDARMAIFGAVALALAYYGRRRDQSAAA
jgi:hypothetical protein